MELRTVKTKGIGQFFTEGLCAGGQHSINASHLDAYFPTSLKNEVGEMCLLNHILFSRCSLQRYFKNWNKTSKFPCFAPTSLSSSHSFSINFANQTDSQPMPTSAPCPAVAGSGEAASDGPMTCCTARLGVQYPEKIPHDF